MSSLFIYNQVFDVIISLPYCTIWLMALVFNIGILTAFSVMVRDYRPNIIKGVNTKEHVYEIVKLVYLAIILYGVIVWNPIAISIVYMSTYKQVNKVIDFLSQFTRTFKYDTAHFIPDEIPAGFSNGFTNQHNEDNNQSTSFNHNIKTNNQTVEVSTADLNASNMNEAEQDVFEHDSQNENNKNDENNVTTHL